jgi:26S proteasome regulatory subunit N5
VRPFPPHLTLVPDLTDTPHSNSDHVKCFIDPELRRWPNIQELYGDALRRTKVFGATADVEGVEGDIEEEKKHAKGEKRWKVLHDRIVEHVR